MTTEQIKILIPEYQKQFGTTPIREWNFSNLANWEYNLLKEIGAITDDGVNNGYPVIKIVSEKDTHFEDLGGDLQQINNAVAMYNANGKKEKASVHWSARLFGFFRDAQKELFDKEEQQKREDKYQTATSLCTQ